MPTRSSHKCVPVLLAFAVGACLGPLLGLPVYHDPTYHQTHSEDALARRAYLVRRLSQEAYGPDDIALFSDLFKGEYAFGTYAMAGYALVQIALEAPQTRPESVRILAHLIDEMQTERLSRFDTHKWANSALAALDPDQVQIDRGHIAYLGHLNLLIGGYRLIGGDDRYDTLHDEITTAIARRMRRHPHRHVETYPYETYTMDNMVSVASLAVADHVSGSDHRVLIGEYRDYTERHLLDEETGLIVFELDQQTGRPRQRGRGSAAGWASFFLPFIDKGWSRRQFEALREHMVTQLGPFAAVREYHPEDPDAGPGDIDSGPVWIWGVSATGFSIAGARHHRHRRLYHGLTSTAELFGVTLDRGPERRYLSSPLLGDAILLAMRTARPWWDDMGEAR